MADRYAKFRAEIEPALAAKRSVETDAELPGSFLRTHGYNWKRPKLKPWTRAMEKRRMREQLKLENSNKQTENGTL